MLVIEVIVICLVVFNCLCKIDMIFFLLINLVVLVWEFFKLFGYEVLMLIGLDFCKNKEFLFRLFIFFFIE